MLVNSGLLYRYGSKLLINYKPKNQISFLRNRFKNISYKSISKQNLHSESISNHVAVLDKNKKVPLKEVKKSLNKRTQMDKKRKNSPLIKVKDAVVIRTDKLNKKQVLSKMSTCIEKIY